jgi:hypothetical protein
LTLSIITQLEQELELLAKFRGSTRENEDYIPIFHQKMIELVDASHSVGKPICF